MSTLLDIQDAFRIGVLGDDDGPARGFIVEDEISADRRVGIYRNNTLISLSKSLAACYPVVERLVGERFFDHAARIFVKIHPPTQPQLLAYGNGFGAFLDDFEPARSVPYVGDVARLEWARNEALFADEAPVVSIASLQAIPIERYGDLRFRLHPSARIVSSRWPVQAIWQANQLDDVPPVDIEHGGETVLILRPGAQIESQLLSIGERAMFLAIDARNTLEQAAMIAVDEDCDFDLQEALVGHLQRGTFTSVSLDNPPGDHTPSEPLPGAKSPGTAE